MQSKESNIDHAFHEGLKDIKVIPPADAWNGIEQRMAEGPGFSVWKRVAASIAILILAGSALWLINHREYDATTTNDIPGRIQDAADQPAPAVVEEHTETPVETGAIAPPERTAGIPTTQHQESPPLAGSEPASTALLSRDARTKIMTPAEKEPVKEVQDLVVSESVLMAILQSRFPDRDVLPEDEMDPGLSMPDTPREQTSRWGLNGSISPIYSFRHVSTSPTGAKNEFFYDKENPAYGFTGGISAIFKKYKRLSFVTGIHFTRSGQSYSDVIFYQNIETGNILQTGILRTDMPYPFENSMGQITSGDYPHYLADYILPSGELSSGGLSGRPEFDDYESFLADLNQTFDFLEIPLLIKYKVLDKKVGIHVVSGVGTNLMIDNEVFLYHKGEKVNLGETVRLNKFNFTGSLGVGFEYNLNYNWSLSFEPTFRYFLNSINTSSSTKTHPYYFGVYSGMNIYF
jgi:hypothetical protein